MIKVQRNWIEPSNQSIPAGIAALFPEHPFLAQALYQRGIQDEKQARSFFNADLYLPSPTGDFPDMAKAVERILGAIQQTEIIGIWGDFDVDGQTSTALLVSALRALSARVEYRIPVRATESHGIQPKNLDEFLQKGIQLIITCDTGISASEAIELAQSRQVDVIVTDHHSIAEDLPRAFAIINPTLLPEAHPMNALSGVGTAFQLAKTLLEISGQQKQIESLLDLVALGTIADLADLDSENRYLVQKGLTQLRKNERKGLAALLKIADVDAKNLTEEQISFIIAPRMNAIGRLEDANPMVEFLTTDNEVIASKLALELEKLNFRRKLSVDMVYKSALDQLVNSPFLIDQPVMVLADVNWETGVNGIVASRLVNQFNKPALVITKSLDGIAHGSARSIADVDIFQLINDKKESLENYGGHPMAAGFSLKSELIDQFRDQINYAYNSFYCSKPIQNDLKIDSFLSFSSLDISLANEVEKMAPFGPGNPRFVFVAPKTRILQHSTIGKNKEHLKVKAQDESGVTREILWWQGDESLLPDGEIDLAFSLRAHDYQGKSEIQLEWVDWRESEKKVVLLRKSPYRILDYRLESAQDFLYEIESLKLDDMSFWAEGKTVTGLITIDRTQLQPVKTLVILTIPPSRKVLLEGLEKAKPNEIWLGGINPGMDEIREFQSRLIGLLKHAIKAKDGIIDIHLMAALTSQTYPVVEKGIRLAAAMGYLTIEDQSETHLKIGLGGSLKPEREKTISNELTSLLKENRAFRRFYLSTNPDQLLTQ